MKRKAMIFILLIMAVLAATAQTTLQFTSPMPKDARSMGMGGAFRVFSQGYSSFFGNPAGFAGMSSLTLMDMSTWAYLAPTSENLGRVQSIVSGSASNSDIMGWAGDWLAKNNGLGAGMSMGAGWVGAKGISIGFNVITDELAQGNSVLGAKLISSTQGNAVLGLAYPIQLGPVWLKVGVDGRVFYRMQSDPTTGWPFSTILNKVLDNSFSPSDLTFFGGYGFGADAGVILGLGPIMFGFTARDFGLEFKVGQFTAQDIVDKTISAFPLAGTIPAALTPSYAAGIGIKLFENGLFEPAVYAEVDDPMSIFSSSDMLSTAFNSLHAGMQLRLLRFLSVRAGLNKGWYSLGAGLDLSLFEFDTAIFTEELGMYPGDKGRSGIAIQGAIRFGR
ncbi:MAG: hypothetical protein ACOYVH_08840 [Spirochaetota bacterium]|jgi:hypothetical protein